MAESIFEDDVRELINNLKDLTSSQFAYSASIKCNSKGEAQFDVKVKSDRFDPQGMKKQMDEIFDGLIMVCSDNHVPIAGMK